MHFSFKTVAVSIQSVYRYIVQIVQLQPLSIGGFNQLTIVVTLPLVLSISAVQCFSSVIPLETSDLIIITLLSLPNNSYINELLIDKTPNVIC